MRIFIQLNQNRVVGYGDTRGTSQDVELDVSEDHEVLRHPLIFTYEGGQLMKDEAYHQQLIREKEERMNKQSVDQRLSLMQQAVDDLILGGGF